MICFPNCKINLGLHVTAKRTDGYHDIETVFYPVNWCDALEITAHPKEKEFELRCSGESIAGPHEKNLIYKAWKMLAEKRAVPPLLCHLLKKIPMGAGLGGGSSDAAFFLKLINTLFDLRFSNKELCEIAARLGSDCVFFMQNEASLAHGRGDELRPISVNLDDYYILLVYPNVFSDTSKAYAGVTPRKRKNPLEQILQQPVDEWRNKLVNDFEESLFPVYPQLQQIKDRLYETGAVYASLSGSGSALYGIYRDEPSTAHFAGNICHLQQPLRKIL